MGNAAMASFAKTVFNTLNASSFPIEIDRFANEVLFDENNSLNENPDHFDEVVTLNLFTKDKLQMGLKNLEDKKFHNRIFAFEGEEPPVWISHSLLKIDVSGEYSSTPATKVVLSIELEISDGSAIARFDVSIINKGKAWEFFDLGDHQIIGDIDIEETENILSSFVIENLRHALR